MLLWFVLGCCVGSFLNVVALRLPKGEDFIQGHSYCPHCHHFLSIVDLIPIVSWLCLKGRCRYCHERISMRYGLVEMFVGIGFVVIAQQVSQVGTQWSWIVLFSMSVVCTLIDATTGEVYPGVLAVCLVGQLVCHFLFQAPFFLPSIFIAGAFYGGIYGLGWLIWKEEAFGIGDIYYLMTIAAWYSVREIVFIGLFAFIVAGIFVGVNSILRKKCSREIYFIPYIFMAQIIVFMVGLTVFGW